MHVKLERGYLFLVFLRFKQVFLMEREIVKAK